MQPAAPGGLKVPATAGQGGQSGDRDFVRRGTDRKSFRLVNALRIDDTVSFRLSNMFRLLMQPAFHPVPAVCIRDLHFFNPACRAFGLFAARIRQDPDPLVFTHFSVFSDIMPGPCQYSCGKNPCTGARENGSSPSRSAFFSCRRACVGHVS